MEEICKYRDILVNVLSGYIQKLDYPLSYNGDFYCYNNNMNYNCYAYALGLMALDNYRFLSERHLSIYNPGTISNLENIDYDEKSLVNAVMADCDMLGLKYIPTDFNNRVYSGTNKIAIYIGVNDEFIKDFHFLRLNGNGIWSHMEGLGGPVSYIDEDIFEILFSQYSFVDSGILVKKKKIIYC